MKTDQLRAAYRQSCGVSPVAGLPYLPPTTLLDFWHHSWMSISLRSPKTICSMSPYRKKEHINKRGGFLTTAITFIRNLTIYLLNKSILNYTIWCTSKTQRKLPKYFSLHFMIQIEMWKSSAFLQFTQVHKKETKKKIATTRHADKTYIFITKI